MVMGPEMQDLMTTSSFGVEIDGIVIGTFKEVSGIDSTTQVVEYRESTATGQMVLRKIPGSASWSDVTLRKRLDTSMDLWEWRQSILEGDIDGARRNGSIIMFDSQLNERARWNFVNGWPSSWRGADFDAAADEIALEEMTISHEGLERVEA